jgi:hypothetical protein
MLVKELIKILQEQCNPELEVLVVYNGDEFNPEFEVIDFHHIDGYVLLPVVLKDEELFPYTILTNPSEEEEE